MRQSETGMRRQPSCLRHRPAVSSVAVTSIPSDPASYRQRLDDQLRADIEMVYNAYLAKVRAYETLATAQGAIEAGRTPLALGAALPASELTLTLPAASRAMLAATGSAVLEPPALPAALPQPAPRPKPPRVGDYEVYDAVLAALGQLGEVFDKNDLIRLLSCKPHRGTLYRVLEDLVYKEGRLILEERGSGTVPNRYRQVKTAMTEPAG